MSKGFEPSLKEILERINQSAERMKKARLIDDKVGYDIALKEYERLHKKYGHLLYEKREPTVVYNKRW